MARSAIRHGNEMDLFASLGLPPWKRRRGDFNIDFLRSHQG